LRTRNLYVLVIAVLAFVLAGCAQVVSGADVVSQARTSVSRMQAAVTQDSAQAAVQRTIERGNAEQEQAIANRDSSLMRDTSTDAYFTSVDQTNRNLLNGGVTAIKLINLEWGDVNVNGDTATATTYETWSTTFSDGSSEQSRDRNVYTLVMQDGDWKISSDEHPDDVVTTGPAAPGGGATSSASDPGQAIVPRGRGRSSNWAGYAAGSGTFTSVTGTWTVPQPSASPAGSSDAAWVGIGGESTRDLIQAGTQQEMLGSGDVQYSAWIEMLPQASRTIPLAVHAGDSITVTLAEQEPSSWQIEFQNHTTGGSYVRTVQYRSSHSSAEWVEEAPSGRQGLLPLTNFGAVTFSNATAVKDGQVVNLTQSGAQPIVMINGNDQPIATTSSVSADGTSFTVQRTENPSTGGTRVRVPRVRVGI
jgi:hypothetical protein